MKQDIWPVTIHKIFADNLRQHCARFESIASLCRASGINRQQFNRYLSGQNLPNPRTLSRLSEVLGVSESSLFQTGKISAGPAQTNEPRALDFSGLALALGAAGHQAQLAGLKRIVEKQQVTDFISGYYFCYIPLINQPDIVLRTLIKVTNTGGIARFTRRTAYSKIDQPKTQYAVGRHTGVMLSDVHSTIFIGFNAIYPHEVSVMKATRRWTDNSAPTPGLAIIRSPQNIFACKICFEWIGTGYSAGKAGLKWLGILSQTDPSITHMVRDLISAKEVGGIVFPPTLDGALDSVNSLVQRNRT